MTIAKYLTKCKKTRIDRCKGALRDSAEKYDKWAYWCGVKRDGWYSAPCEHIQILKES